MFKICFYCDTQLAKRTAGADDVMHYCPSCRKVYAEGELKPKEYIYLWRFPATDIYITADNVNQARVMAMNNANKLDILFSQRRKIMETSPQKWCRGCVKDRKWPPLSKPIYMERRGE